MLLLDTRDLPAADRAEAFAAAVQEVAAPCRIEQRDPLDELQAHVQMWPYGQAALLSTDTARFRRTAAGHGESAQLGHELVVRDDDLMLIDMGTPDSFGCATGGGARVFLVPYDLLALPEDVVRRAIPRLRASPLHDLVHAHLSRMAATAPELAADPGAAALGTATVELVRALIVSAAGERAGPVRAQTLVSRVRAFVGQHLHDPGLSPAAIAGAHNVSLRQLYKACSEAGVSLEQWIIEQRLEAARAHLASPAGLRRSIAATARAHGFADPSHFTRRFRQAYGLTPREWQRAATA
jgi:AraC-like DNA-binding protein